MIDKTYADIRVNFAESQGLLLNLFDILRIDAKEGVIVELLDGGTILTKVSCNDGDVWNA